MDEEVPIRISGNAERAAFRDELRSARECCARDAEAFNQLLFVVERLGSRLSGRIATLGAYKQKLSQLAKESDLSILEPNGDENPDFLNLFATILEARNDALHQGAVARHTTSRVIELALILEDALASELKQVDFLMVKNPAVANPMANFGRDSTDHAGERVFISPNTLGEEMVLCLRLRRRGLFAPSRGSKG